VTKLKLRFAVVLACGVAAGGVSAQETTTGAAEGADPLAAYEQALLEGSFHTGESLLVADVVYSFDKNLARMDARESAHIGRWYGVHQDGDVATVIYSISAMDVVFSHENTEIVESLCRRLNDGRWFCRAKIDSIKINAAFYVERPVEAELAQGGAAPPAPAPLAPPRR
jgi:hypothetical protein